MENKKQKILLDVGEKDIIVGSPTYGQPILKIQIDGLTPIQAQNILLSVANQLHKQIENDFNNILKKANQ